ncbi:membrane protein [Streptomyces sulfonofaciens]|uniref:Membrane protein insertase YidC n=1 Tax=Streptomyces sulfonofaciens TaxID=68272 RepID=A0A919KXN9_9ACTN|nr:membrane protein insertase YidC [Streptomyces sulfonofaciens]GHH76632.1 membrane protein [Streptomyces sulfonofaciens]
MSVFALFAGLVEHLAQLLQPLFHTSATAVAIVLFTALVRLLVHPLSRAAARGQRAQARLAPRIAELRHTHRKNPDKLQKATMELYKEEKVSPLAGCLPSLLQLPAFFLLYRTFSATRMGGHASALMGHTLFGAPLGGRWLGALGHGGAFGARGLVYLVLFAVVAVIATFNYRKSRQTAAAGAAQQKAAAGATAAGKRSGSGSGSGESLPGLAAVTKAAPLMSFLTLVTVAVAPLAAALYVVTSTAWSAVERAVLYRDMPHAVPHAAGTAQAAAKGAARPARARKSSETSPV